MSNSSGQSPDHSRPILRFTSTKKASRCKRFFQVQEPSVLVILCTVDAPHLGCCRFLFQITGIEDPRSSLQIYAKPGAHGRQVEAAARRVEATDPGDGRQIS